MRKRRKNPRTVAKGVAMILQGLGLDLDDPNLRGTPERVGRVFVEMLSPRELRWATFPARAADVVLLRGHRLVALCPHHLLPVEIQCYIGYVPNELTVGLSKLARIAESRLTKPILQEDLAHDIADVIQAGLKPKGVGVVLAGTHGCMRFRGIESDGDVVTSAMRGIFLLNQAAREELLSLIGRP